MRVARSLFVLMVVVLFAPASAAQEETDFLSVIQTNPDVATKLGIRKLSAAEKASLNALLNAVYRAGYEAGRSDAVATKPAKPRPPLRTPPRVGSTSVRAYKTKVESDDGDILKLANGAVVEVTSGYLGFVGYNKTCVLFSAGGRWRIWVEGKKAYNCDVLKEPAYGSPISAELVYITEVKGDGSILMVDDGSMLEVDSIDTITTGLWLGMSQALLLDDSELINLDDGDEIVLITRIR